MSESPLYFATGNKGKIAYAQKFLSPWKVEGYKLDIDEIQANTIEEIAIDKAQKAFKATQRSIFVSDTGLVVPSLNGFPGPYTKYIIDETLGPRKLHSTLPHNEEVYFEQVIALATADGDIKTFISKEYGYITPHYFEGKLPPYVQSDIGLFFVLDGETITQAEYTDKDALLRATEKSYRGDISPYHKLKKYLIDNPSL